MAQMDRFGTAAVSAPHALAADAALGVLIGGGNALEAAVALAATLAVVRPDLATLGGDAAWLVVDRNRRVRVIEAIGGPAAAATPQDRDGDDSDGEDPDGEDPDGEDLDGEDLDGEDLDGEDPQAGAAVVRRAPASGTAWSLALEMARAFGGRMPLDMLLGEAARHAREGVALAPALAASRGASLAARRPALDTVPGLQALFGTADRPLGVGERFVQARLADTLDHLAHAGMADLVRGDVAREMAADLERLGSPLGRADLSRTEARLRDPFALALAHARPGASLFAARAGLRALHAVGLATRLGSVGTPGEALVAACIRSATASLDEDPAARLSPAALDQEAAGLPPGRALPDTPLLGDGLWFGVVDGEGLAVGVAVSPGPAWGSGLVLPATGVLMGATALVAPSLAQAAMLDPDGALTLLGAGGAAPAQGLAQLTMAHVAGADGGGVLAAPRFMIGRLPGRESPAVQVEEGWDEAAIRNLRAAGTEVRLHPASPVFGEAGALARSATGHLAAASDPRGDGQAAGL